MQTNTALVALLLQSITTSCLARSSQRSVPLNALNLPALLNTSLSDPALPIAALPYEVPLNDGLDTKLRIISYYAPHVQSFDLLPCLVNMMTTAFNNVYENPNPHAKLLQNQYTCSANSFGLQITGNQIMTPPLEYSDLISLARMLLLFQQTHTMPGLRFEYWLKGQMRGQGHAWMLFVQGSNGSESLGQS